MESLEWYAIRATGIVAYLLLYLAVLTGLYSAVQKKRKKKVNNLLLFHEVLSDWSLIMTAGHLGILLIDAYMKFSWSDILIPFSGSYETISIGLGSIATYFLILTIVTSKFRKKIGYKKWQKLHALNPILYILVTVHGLMSGTDFQGTVLAVVNIVPVVLMLGMFPSDSDKKKLVEGNGAI
ncbi:ferric reductase-like transmembrane domain-containing protein [Bacillus sp. UNC41MFS5]|uniref:ferric reductase-like transmembrane domain-containing protein n=1 Tax=Bacillus sp. UNC41MFS5 TaxID=1449046 RepID=UPI00047D1666|nr:ferric reductase-like transmembrane domain-containing protein [Bacillus sp. UNC41MFS5]